LVEVHRKAAMNIVDWMKSGRPDYPVVRGTRKPQDRIDPGPGSIPIETLNFTAFLCRLPTPAPPGVSTSPGQPITVGKALEVDLMMSKIRIFDNETLRTIV
jgi:hypothetical protein